MLVVRSDHEGVRGIDVFSEDEIPAMNAASAKWRRSGFQVRVISALSFGEALESHPSLFGRSI